jgi:selenocysteine lyase/cysteine desulfurase
VKWTDPWGERKYYPSPEMREDGGTPGFMQTIKAALCIELKNKMGIENIQSRENELLNILFSMLSSIENVHILGENIKDRLGILSFYIENVHYNLIVKILNDYYGIQTRGGCSCAGTYGHYLLNIDRQLSRKIADKINRGDLSLKPGWVRISIHPIMTNKDMYNIGNAIYEISKNITKLEKEYTFNPLTNEFQNIHEGKDYQYCNETWFKF